jgi:two-component system, NarL family, nitrate/nitrite response regulator NarL
MSDRVDTIVIGHHPLVREGLARILPSDSYNVVAQLSELADVESLAQDPARPLLCILAAGESRACTEAVIATLRQRHPLSRVVVLARSYDIVGLVSALRAGAQGYLIATMCSDAFLKSLALIMLGECVLPSAVLAHVRETWTVEGAAPQPEVSRAKPTPRPPGATPLSCRENEILQCVAEGASNKVIARRFDIAEATVKVHLKAILRKLGARNRTQAALWSVSHLGANGTAPLGPTAPTLGDNG